jgi:prepilin-type N-terminal cleavage/methylation domain-containing protein
VFTAAPMNSQATGLPTQAGRISRPPYGADSLPCLYVRVLYERIGMKKTSPTRRNRGFTLIEMMVVISMILILLGVAMPIYSHSIVRAREENLRKNLNTLNFMIYQYTQDKQKAPQSLDDLKTAGYIKEIPDDITGSNLVSRAGRRHDHVALSNRPRGHSRCPQRFQPDVKRRHCIFNLVKNLHDPKKIHPSTLSHLCSGTQQAIDRCPM